MNNEAVSETMEISGDQEVQLVIFRLTKEQYGLPVTKVQDINRMMPITKLPHAPHFVEGIINLRGQIIPVVDLRKRFDLPPIEYTNETRIIIVQCNEQLIGIIVDAVSEVARISAKNIEPPPATFSAETKHVQGVAKREGDLITLLDIDLIITPGETAELRQLSS